MAPTWDPMGPFAPGTVPQPGNWPGIVHDGVPLQVEPDALRSSATALREAVTQTGPSHVSPEVLEARLSGMEGQGLFGQWMAGSYLEQGLHTAGGAVAWYYRETAQQVATAGALLDATALDYEREDQATSDRLDEVAAGWDLLTSAAEESGSTVPVAGDYVDSTSRPVVCTDNFDLIDVGWILQELERLETQQPWLQISTVATDLERVAAQLGTDGLAGAVAAEAQKLAQLWSSDASAACQRALRRIAGTAYHLGQAARRTAEFAHETAGYLQRRIVEDPDGRNRREKFSDFIRWGSDPHKDREIRSFMSDTDTAYVSLYESHLPREVNADLPILPEARSTIDDPEPWAGGSGGGGGAGGTGYVPPGLPAAPDPPLPASLSESVPGAPTGSGGALAGVPGAGGLAGAGVPSLASGLPDTGTGFPGSGPPGGPPSGGLAGAGPAGAPTPGGVPAGGGPAGGAGPGGLGPGGLGPGGTGIVSGAAGSRAGGGSPGSRAGGGGGFLGTPGGGAGAGQSSGGRSGPAAGGRPGAVGGMAPMAGAGRGDDQRHARSDSWLVEDDDPFRPDDDPPPPVLR